MEDKLKIGVVNFHAAWGKKEKNLTEMLEYVNQAKEEQIQLLVFPEMALTGYAYEKEMQSLEAENEQGDCVKRLAEAAKDNGMYLMVGMPYRDIKTNALYNAAGIFSPDGSVRFYKKIHIPLSSELDWASRGTQPLLLETPWGKIGVAICYDVYFFPELIRYYCGMGARLIINLTAYSKGYGLKQAIYPLTTYVFTNQIYIASANLCGVEPDGQDYYGGSCILGPCEKDKFDASYYAGIPFGADGADQCGMFFAEIDLSKAQREIYKKNPVFGTPDFRAELYAGFYEELKGRYE